MIINRENLDLVFKGFKAVYSASFEATASQVGVISMPVESTAAEEEYAWLGQFPDLREWVGDRVINGMKAHGFAIKNKKFETAVTVKRDDLSDDKVGIYKPLFSEMGRVAKNHPDKLVFSMLGTGFNTVCYDGKPFFADNHISGEAPATVFVQSNKQDGAGPAWYLMDASRGVKPIVWQEREPYEFQTVDNVNGEKVFMTDTFLYGIRARVNCGFGLWQLAFGSKAELNADNYAAARAAMAAFVGDRGQPLGVSPTHLVVPPALEKEGRQLLLADTIEGSSNIWKGSADLIMSHYAI